MTRPWVFVSSQSFNNHTTKRALYHAYILSFIVVIVLPHHQRPTCLLAENIVRLILSFWVRSFVRPLFVVVVVVVVGATKTNRGTSRGAIDRLSYS